LVVKKNFRKMTGKFREGNRSERYLAEARPTHGNRGFILLRLWRQRTSVKIGYSELRHVTMLKKGIKALSIIEEQLSVDFEEMLDGVLELYFNQHMGSFPSPSRFFAMADDLAMSWYEQRFQAKPKLPEEDVVTLSIDELVKVKGYLTTI